MRRSILVAVAAVAVCAILVPAGESSAAITVLNLWDLGENDPGAAAAIPGNATTIDAVGAQTLSRSGTPQYTSNVAVVGSSLAMDFQGNGNYHVSPPFNTTTDNFGIEAWVQTDTTAGNGIIAYNGSTSNAGWGIFRNGGSYSGLFGGIAVFGAGAATVGKWTEVALVRSGGTATLYVNGVASGSTGAAPNGLSAANSFMIGGNLTGEYFDGRVDRVRVFTFSPGAFNPATDLLLQSVQVMGQYRLGDRELGIPGQPGGAVTLDDFGVNNLNRSGSPTYSADRPGPGSLVSMDFNRATNDFYSSPNVLTTATDNWILEAWVKADTTTNNGAVAYNGNGGTSGFGESVASLLGVLTL